MNRGLITFLLCLIGTTVVAQSDWHLKKDEEGIKVYTAETPNSNFKSIKVDCIINATVPQIIACLSDMSIQTEWVYNSKSAKLIKQIKENEFAFYSEVSVPWPGTNRDYIAHIVINQVSPTVTTIDSHSDPTLVPEKDGLVRIKKSTAHWELTTINKGSVRIVYTLAFDPAGAAPAWLINLFVTKGPLETFKKLKEEVKKPAYQNAHFDYIKE